MGTAEVTLPLQRHLGICMLNRRGSHKIGRNRNTANSPGEETMIQQIRQHIELDKDNNVTRKMNTHRKTTSQLQVIFGAILLWNLAIATPPSASATALGDLAASMQPGTWAQLTTVNINPTLTNTGGASGFIFGYTDKAVWDPTTRQLFFIGGDHNGVARFVSYADTTNSWQIQTQPPWIPSTVMHGYHHAAINAGSGTLYHRPYHDQTVRKYTIGTKTWIDLPTIPSSMMGYTSAAAGVEYFPERQSLIFASIESGTSGSVLEYKEQTGQWSRIAGGFPMGDPHNIAEYNPIHHVVIFGGGNGSRNLYKLNSSGQVTNLSLAPFPIAVQSTILTVDPVSGTYLILNNDSTFWAYNVTTDTWQQLSTAPAIFSGSNNNPVVHGVIATSISTYGVTMFVKCTTGSCLVYLYKHATGSAPPPPPPTITDRDGDGVPDSTDQCPDAAGSAPSGCPAPAPSSPPVTGSDFQSRCSASGVIKCFGFDDAASTDPYVYPPSGQTQKLGVVVSDIKASGAGSLRFTIPANSGSDTSGSFWQNFSNDLSVQIGEGQEFYYQWRQRFSPEFLNTIFAGGGGWKQSIVGEGDRPGSIAYSCTQLEIVVQNTLQRGFPQMYHSCGAKDGQYQPLDVAVPPTDFALQNAVPGCLYSTRSVPPCVGYKPNQWMTFQVHVKVGTWYKNDGVYHNNSTIQLWVAEEGQPSRLVIDRNPANGTGYDIANNDAAAKYGKLWLLPYHTGKSSAQTNPTGYVWYDDLIISRNKITDPGSSGGSDLQPPSAPVNLRVQ